VQLATFAPCVNVDWFSGCAVAHFGRLRVSGLSLDEPRAPSGMISQAGVRLAASQSLGPVSASLRLEGLRSFHQWTVEVNRSPVWEVPSTSFVLGLDVALPIALGD